MPSCGSRGAWIPTARRSFCAASASCLLFYEPSTRTRTSFEFAAKALGATTTLITATSSSIEKGESLIDTGWTVTALGADAIVMRHPSSGAPYLLSRYVPVPVINAGDGLHQHPSQALLDALTITNHKKRLKGLRVVIVGDVFHSRVARSNAHSAFQVRRGSHLLRPVRPRARRFRHHRSRRRRLPRSRCRPAGADVVMSLRIQKERLAGMPIRLEDYIAKFQVTPQRMKLARPDAIVMHPGPIVRGLELANEVADGPQSVMHEQVANGVKTRMAILATVLKAAR